MSERDAIAAMLRRLLAERADPQTLLLQEASEAGAIDQAAALWPALVEVGLPQAWSGPEPLGGGDLGRIALVAGEFALTAPLIETQIAQRLAAQAGIALPETPIGLAPTGPQERFTLDPQGRISGSAERLVLAAQPGPLLLAAEDSAGRPVAALVAAPDNALRPRPGYAGHPRARLRLERVAVQASGALEPGAAEQALVGAAVLRACQIAGALRRCLELATAYAQERRAFGRPIGKFQAVQHSLARLAGEAAVAEAAAGAAAERLEALAEGDATAWIIAASAKIRAGEAAGEGARIAHQAFGAIGFTAEHVLHRYTHSLWAWRDDYGSEALWARLLGARMARAGPAAYWPVLAGGSAP